MRCGFLICLDWAFPELWIEYAGKVELIFHSCVTDNAWLNSYAISVSNSCRPSQAFASFWIERSGHAGGRASANETGFVLNALADDPEQDRFFEVVRSFRESATNGSLYAPHRPDVHVPVQLREKSSS